MKTKKELNALKKEVEDLNEKLNELTEEELEQVSGGGINPALLTNPALFTYMQAMSQWPTAQGNLIEK